MISVKKFWACVLFICIIGTFVAIYGESKKSVSQEQPKYELKSDILNFDYTKLSYPTNSVTIGVDTGNKTLKERKPGKEPTFKEKVCEFLSIFCDSVIHLFVFMCITSTCYGIFALVPSMVIYGVLHIREVRNRKREDEENMTKKAEELGLKLSDI